MNVTMLSCEVPISPFYFLNIFLFLKNNFYFILLTEDPLSYHIFKCILLLGYAYNCIADH